MHVVSVGRGGTAMATASSLCGFALSALLSGCTATDGSGILSFEDVANHCPLNGSGDLLVGPSEFRYEVPVDCSEVVGTVFGVDWDSFGYRPREFWEATGPAELVVGAFLVVLQSSQITVGDTVRDPAPDTLASTLQELAAAQRICTDCLVGPVWFEYLTERVHGVRYTGADGYSMAYNAEYRLVGVGDLLNGGGGVFSDPSVAVLAGQLVHEAAHFDYGGHLVCSDASGDYNCDATHEGAYGSGVWWEWLWIPNEETAARSEVYERASEAIESWCCRIGDGEEWAPCASGGDSSAGC